MMTINYITTGVCARSMKIEVDNGVVQSVEIEGGCNGNLQGLSVLVKGMEVNEVIPRLEGINCGARPTSCPDQLATALKQAL